MSIPYYEIKNKLSSGAFGTVWVISMEKKEYAMKIVKIHEDYINREEDLIKSLQHENIVKYVNSWTEHNKLHIIMECIPSTLAEYIKHNTFTTQELKKVARDIFTGLEYIHSKSICHRDIKPDNLLFHQSLMRVKICDFGCSKIIEDEQPNTYYICSRYYRAPELILGATLYSTAIDMWSAGCVLAELVTKAPLFKGCDSVNHQLSEIVKVIGMPTSYDCLNMKVKRFRYNGEIRIRHLRDTLYEYMEFGLINILSKIFVYDPTKRLTATNALQQEYFTQLNILDTCISIVKEEYEHKNIDNIEECIRELYHNLNEKHKMELELQEKTHQLQYKSFIDSPIERGGKKWSSPVAGVFSRIKHSP